MTESWTNRFLLPCPFKHLTGIDCPGCGFQRSVLALLKGNWMESWHYYPATVPILLLVVFFKNTELEKITKQPAGDVEEIYIKTIAEQFLYEKKVIVKELNQYGIHSILCDPKDLTASTINKYLEIKAKQQL